MKLNKLIILLLIIGVVAMFRMGISQEEVLDENGLVKKFYHWKVVDLYLIETGELDGAIVIIISPDKKMIAVVIHEVKNGKFGTAIWYQIYELKDGVAGEIIEEWTNPKFERVGEWWRRKQVL